MGTLSFERQIEAEDPRGRGCYYFETGSHVVSRHPTCVAEVHFELLDPAAFISALSAGIANYV